MKIEKAIEILTDSIADNTLLITLEHDAAVKLGVEALKRVDNVHRHRAPFYWELLPGETED